MIKLYSILLLLFLSSCISTRYHVMAEPWDVGKVSYVNYENDTTYVFVTWYKANQIKESEEQYMIKGFAKNIYIGDSLLINTNWEGEPTLLSTKTNKKMHHIVNYINNETY